MAKKWYRAFVYQNPGDGPDDGWDVIFRDFPGCVSQGDTREDALSNGKEALALHLEGMVAEGLELPEGGIKPNDPDPRWILEIKMQNPVYQFLEMDVPGKSTRINITMDEALINRLDAAASSEGTTRSGYLAQAVREKLQRNREPV
ncbi:MAG TPA: type II toxin-antitoxin system HicB family antitoxin [Rhizomicrobium sp.]